MDPEHWGKFAYVATAVWAGFQFWRGQVWQRKEFIVAQYNAFKTDPAVTLATTMLDWQDRKLPIIPEAESRFTQDMLLTALITDQVPFEVRFTREEAIIRDTFSIFLDWLEQFDEFIHADALSLSDIRPYIGYWIDLIGDSRNKRLAPHGRQQIWRFIDDYNYRGVQHSCLAFGYDIKAIDYRLVFRTSNTLLTNRAPTDSQTYDYIPNIIRR